MKLIFKYVGQGDSIIIHWKNDVGNNFVVIDCNKFNKSNPVLDYISSFDNPIVPLVVLSHPHTDHYSGMLDLLEGCLERDIEIKRFYHTARHESNYLNHAVVGTLAKSQLGKLFRFIKGRSRSGSLKIGSIDAVTNGPYNLADGYKLKFLSPTDIEYDNYVRLSSIPKLRREKENNPDANELSTIISIESPTEYYLLTSDCYKKSLIRIDKEGFENDKKLILGQVPHHGSFKNHSPGFWKKRNWKGEKTVVISSGVNKYGHPSEEVLKFFKKKGFILHMTHRLDKFPKKVEKGIRHFDSFTTLATSKGLNDNDVVFELNS